MIKIDYTVQGPLGWCARASSVLVQSVIYTKSICRYKIISRPPNSVGDTPHEDDLKSIMRVLMGAASKGTVVEISIDGPDEIEVAKAVKIALVRSEDFK